MRRKPSTEAELAFVEELTGMPVMTLRDNLKAILIVVVLAAALLGWLSLSK